MQRVRRARGAMDGRGTQPSTASAGRGDVPESPRRACRRRAHQTREHSEGAFGSRWGWSRARSRCQARRGPYDRPPTGLGVITRLLTPSVGPVRRIVCERLPLQRTAPVRRVATALLCAPWRCRSVRAWPGLISRGLAWGGSGLWLSRPLMICSTHVRSMVRMSWGPTMARSSSAGSQTSPGRAPGSGLTSSVCSQTVESRSCRHLGAADLVPRPSSPARA